MKRKSPQQIWASKCVNRYRFGCFSFRKYSMLREKRSFQKELTQQNINGAYKIVPNGKYLFHRFTQYTQTFFFLQPLRLRSQWPNSSTQTEPEIYYWTLFWFSFVYNFLTSNRFDFPFQIYEIYFNVHFFLFKYLLFFVCFFLFIF